MVKHHILEISIAIIVIITIALIIRASFIDKEDSVFHFEIYEFNDGTCLVQLIVNDDTLQSWTFSSKKEAEDFIENF